MWCWRWALLCLVALGTSYYWCVSFNTTNIPHYHHTFSNYIVKLAHLKTKDRHILLPLREIFLQSTYTYIQKPSSHFITIPSSNTHEPFYYFSYQHVFFDIKERKHLTSWLRLRARGLTLPALSFHLQAVNTKQLHKSLKWFVAMVCSRNRSSSNQVHHISTQDANPI